MLVLFNISTNLRHKT